MLAIELVLAQKPKLLLLDEPTAALSAELAKEILNIIYRCTSSTGAAALLVEQNAQAALKIADHALRLNQGTITNDKHSP